MISEEEKNAIENLKKNFIIMNNGEIYKSDDYILYNLILKLEKVIDLFADKYWYDCGCSDGFHSPEEVKQMFFKKAEGENDKD